MCLNTNNLVRLLYHTTSLQKLIITSMSVIASHGNVRWPRRVLPLVSHVDHSPRALLMLEEKGQTDRRRDGRVPDRVLR